MLSNPVGFDFSTSPAVSSDGKYFRVTSTTTGKLLTDVNKFVVGKALAQILPVGFQVTRRMRDGGILCFVPAMAVSRVKLCERKVCARTNLELTLMIESFKTMNTCKGRIFCPEILDMSDEEICKELSQESESDKEVPKWVVKRYWCHCPYF